MLDNHAEIFLRAFGSCRMPKKASACFLLGIARAWLSQHVILQQCRCLLENAPSHNTGATHIGRKIFFERCFAMHSLPLRVRSCIHPTFHPTFHLSFLTSFLTFLCVRSCTSQLLIRSSSLAVLALPPHWRKKGGWPAETNGRVAGMSRSLYILCNP